MSQECLLNVKGAANFLAVPKSTVYQMVFKRVIPHYKLGRSVRFRETDLTRYVEAARVEPMKA